MAWTFEQLRNGYAALLKTMTVSPTKRSAFDSVAAKITRGRGTYEQISKLTGVPWYFIGVLHNRESGCNFSTHLHNGDPLTARTKNVPAGRPLTGAPPFSFVFSAVDALKMKGLHTITDWSEERMCFELERYNGFGYRGKVNSPYLWAGTNHYTKGKYIADHVWSATAVDQQLGGVPLIRLLRTGTVPATPRSPVPETAGTVAVGTGAGADRDGGDERGQERPGGGDRRPGGRRGGRGDHDHAEAVMGLHFYLLVLSGIAIIYVIGKTVSRYRAATGTPRERLWASVRDSATVAVSYVGILLSAVLGVAAQLSDMFYLPEVSNAVKMLVSPEIAPLLPLIVAVLAYLARLRTLP
jgi:lysozyme family protein